MSLDNFVSRLKQGSGNSSRPKLSPPTAHFVSHGEGNERCAIGAGGQDPAGESSWRGCICIAQLTENELRSCDGHGGSSGSSWSASGPRDRRGDKRRHWKGGGAVVLGSVAVLLVTRQQLEGPTRPTCGS